MVKNKDKIMKRTARELSYIATQCRLNVMRMLAASGHGHVGGAMSAMDIAVALYFGEMNVDPHDPKKRDRDRFILSAGHKCLAQYAILAEMGYFDKKILDTYGSLNSRIPGHPNMHELPGIEANTGALGHGLSIANGMAAALKLQKLNSRVFVIMGDGELPEGSNWEAAAQAAKFKLDNLVLFVDYNGLQISGHVEDVLNMQPIEEKFKAYSWDTHIIENGNDMTQIIDSLDKINYTCEKPHVFIAKTVKAKDVVGGENNVAYHFWKPSPEQIQQTVDYLNQKADKLQKAMEA
jgi:transketolase